MTPRSQNPADLVKHYIDLIAESRRKLEESLSEIAEYSERLHRITAETSQRLLSRD